MISGLLLYDKFIDFIIFDKVIFILLALTEYYYKNISSSKTKDDTIKILEFFKERAEFIFIFSMSILIIILFRKTRTITINSHLMILFIAYGLINLFSVNWSLLTKESSIYKTIKKIIDK